MFDVLPWEITIKNYHLGNILYFLQPPEANLSCGLCSYIYIYVHYICVWLCFCLFSVIELYVVFIPKFISQLLYLRCSSQHGHHGMFYLCCDVLQVYTSVVWDRGTFASCKLSSLAAYERSLAPISFTCKPRFFFLNWTTCLWCVKGLLGQ